MRRLQCRLLRARASRGGGSQNGILGAQGRKVEKSILWAMPPTPGTLGQPSLLLDTPLKLTEQWL